MKSKKTMKATFEIKFNPDLMCDQNIVNEEFNGSWLKLMKWLYKEEGMGIFDNNFKLIKIEKL